MASTSYRRQSETINRSPGRQVVQQDASDDNDTSDWLDSVSEATSTTPDQVGLNNRQRVAAKTDRHERYSTKNTSKSSKKMLDDSDAENDILSGFLRKQNDNQQRSKSRPGLPDDKQSLQTAHLQGDDGNLRHPGGRRAPGSNGRDDDDDHGDDDDVVWSQAHRTSNEPGDGDETVPPPGGGLTFYGKPIFGSATDFDLWKDRVDHGGGMPYRNGAAEPWLSSLRRPVKYSEIGRHEAKLQRLQQKWEDRVAWKTYTELQNEKNGTMTGPGTVVPGTGHEMGHGNTMNGSPHCAACWNDYDYGQSPIARPQGPSPNKMVTCRDCHGGQYCSQAKVGGLPTDSKYIRMPPRSALLPPISGTATSQSVPLTISATPGGEMQKVSIDINLKLVTPRDQNYQKTPVHQGVDYGQPSLTSRTYKANSATGSPRKEPTHRCTAECANGKSNCTAGRATEASYGGREPFMNCRTMAPCGQQQCQNCKSDHVTQHMLTDLARPMTNWPPAHWIVPPLGLGNDVMAKAQPQQQPVQLSPKTHRHVKFGRHGEYRVFCIDDYKKMKREMKLAGTFGADKDPETLQEKREKLAIQKGYGKLVNDRNQMELALLKSKRIHAALMAGDGDGLE